MYSYRCEQCRTTWPVTSRREAEAERKRHRDHVHAGGTPDGDSIQQPPRPPLPPQPPFLATPLRRAVSTTVVFGALALGIWFRTLA
ncbi:hypothetical protein ACIO13_24690 [Streptomyces sp. NPDC087425]|uniref:hypothetical protein n=1 Tax=Streptomyces sp. NPDC087425 TaxID=3365787 RepID=UPI00381D50B9